MNLEALPGGDLVQEGIADLSRGIESVPALLVSLGAPRLRRIGLSLPERVIPTPEHCLYEVLARTDPDSAHSRYNALIRRLVSFENAAECGGLAPEPRKPGRLKGRIQIADDFDAPLPESIARAFHGD